MVEFSLLAQDFQIYPGDGHGKNTVARTSNMNLHFLHRAGAKGIVLGHSEVNDNESVVNKKLKAVIEYHQKYPSFNEIIVLIGDDGSEFLANEKDIESISNNVVERASEIFNDISEDQLASLRLIVGYEPKWGSNFSGLEGKEAKAELIKTCLEFLKKFFSEKYPKLKIPLIYGGKSSNEKTEKIMKDKNLQGLILGSACDSPQKTLGIAESMMKSAPDREKIISCNFKAFPTIGENDKSYRNYWNTLKKLPGNYRIHFIPNYADIREIREFF